MNAIDVLLDTNIVIYALDGQEKYVNTLRHLGILGMSVLSYMEVLLGIQDFHEEHAAMELTFGIEIVPLDSAVAFDATQSLQKRAQKNLRSPLLPDTVIAHTALVLNVPLVTNNPKDFAMFKGLKLIVP